jgi:tRNA(fMet)-specific endonuclease VapC
MDKAVLDTDILSEVLKARDDNVVSRAVAYKSTHGQLTMTVISVMEIVKGLHKVGREDALRRFLNGLETSEVLAFDQASAKVAGQIYADLENAGLPIGYADVMVAAIALRHKFTLVTGNRRHYEHIRSLNYPLILDNWRELLET